MVGALQGFLTIAAVIGCGWVLADRGVLDLTAQRALVSVSFLLATPALLLTLMARTPVGPALTRGLLATALAVAVVVVPYVVWALGVARHGLGETVVGALAAGYVNAGYLGLPVATYVLGDASLVVPTLLLQVLILQPFALALLDVDAARTSGRARSTHDLLRTAALRPVRNPITVAALAGALLSLTGTQLPAVVAAPASLVGAAAVPTMLLAYGVSLRLGPRLTVGDPEVVLTSVLKALVQPLAAFLIARFALGLAPAVVLAVTVTSALPTAQNVFAHATRYRRGETVARDTILLTTLAAAPVILLTASVLD